MILIRNILTSAVLKLAQRGLPAGFALFLSAFSYAANVFHDPLDTPANQDPVATTAPLTAVAAAGSGRYVAVGQRGLILVSEDGARTWKQSPSPVSTDLTAVYFADGRNGWAVGHDAVILHTPDGGGTWTRQVDFRKTTEWIKAQAASLEASGSPKAALVKTESEIYAKQPSVRPFMYVWFQDPNTGFVIGGYNLIFRTDDGGQHWTSLFDRTDNEKVLHLSVMGKAGNDVFIAGEQGLVLWFDPATRNFVRRTQPYDGSFFAGAVRNGTVVLCGMRGSAFRTRDGGKTWNKLDTQSEHAIAAVRFMPDGRLVMLAQVGDIHVSRDEGDHIQTTPPQSSTQYADFVPLDDTNILLVGSRGIEIRKLPD